jgi:hypothetical protein
VHRWSVYKPRRSTLGFYIALAQHRPPASGHCHRAWKAGACLPVPQSDPEHPIEPDALPQNRASLWLMKADPYRDGSISLEPGRTCPSCRARVNRYLAAI